MSWRHLNSRRHDCVGKPAAQTASCGNLASLLLAFLLPLRKKKKKKKKKTRKGKDKGQAILYLLKTDDFALFQHLDSIAILVCLVSGKAHSTKGAGTKSDLEKERKQSEGDVT